MKLAQEVLTDDKLGRASAKGQPRDGACDVVRLDRVERGTGGDRDQQPRDLVWIEGRLSVLVGVS